MEFLTSKEVSVLWGISQCRIIRLAREGRIDGAVQFGNRWMFPKTVQKPVDARTKREGHAETTDFFRFPLYVNFPADAFVPPLTKEELQLRTAQVDLYACNFPKAQRAFSYLADHAENIYVKIGATAFMAALSSVYRREINYRTYYDRLCSALAQDFPHKKDMEMLLPWLNCFCGFYGSVSKHFDIDPQYNYHPSVQNLMAFLSIFRLAGDNFENIHAIDRLTQFEILSRIMESSGYFFEAQELHRILFVAYYLSHENTLMLFHLRRAISIAHEHNLLLCAVDLLSYYPNVYREVIGDFPAEFNKTIRLQSEIISRNYADFTKHYNFTEIYSNLSSGDFQLLLYVFNGYSNKVIAEKTHFSPQTVSNKLSDIYEKLNIKSRQELVELFQDCLKEKTST